VSCSQSAAASTGAPVHYEQTVKWRRIHGCTGTLMSKQPGGVASTRPASSSSSSSYSSSSSPFSCSYSELVRTDANACTRLLGLQNESYPVSFTNFGFEQKMNTPLQKREKR